MSFSDFRKYFDGFSICHYNDNFTFSSSEALKFKKNGDYKFVKMKIFNPGSYTITLALKTRRWNKYEDKKFKTISY